MNINDRKEIIMKSELISKPSLVEVDEKLIELNKLSKNELLEFANTKQYTYFTNLGAYKLNTTKVSH